jgi:hypothetical protein
MAGFDANLGRSRRETIPNNDVKVDIVTPVGPVCTWNLPVLRFMPPA